MPVAQESKAEKQERLPAAIEFDNPDRMPVRGGCFSEDAVAAITARMQNMFDDRGGVILVSSSSIMPDTRVESILELYRR